MLERYSPHEADSLDRLIRSALCAAAEKLPILKEKKVELLNRIKKNKTES